MARLAAKGRKPAWNWGTRMAGGSCSSPEPRPARETPLAEPDRIRVPSRLIEAGRPPLIRRTASRNQGSGTMTYLRPTAPKTTSWEDIEADVRNCRLPGPRFTRPSCAAPRDAI
jgi:hypothetical protein